MPKIRRSAQVPYTAAQMFALVNDIEAYPEFLKWCRGARVLRRDAATVEAELEVAVGGLSKRFATRNTLHAPDRIEMSLLSGPFRRLGGQWTFVDKDDDGCEVELSLDFEVKASPFSFLFASIFEEIARSQMSGFLRRADEVYGD